MQIVRVFTLIDAPREVVFDLARSIDFHQRAAESTGERAVAGTTSGLISEGQSVTWEARHLGWRHTLQVGITEFDRPTHFQDTMIAGPFKRMVHDHHFIEKDDRILMTDRFEFEAPLGFIGLIAERLILYRHLMKFLKTRGQAIKDASENGDWKNYIQAD